MAKDNNRKGQSGTPGTGNAKQGRATGSDYAAIYR
jgi:hypothetical protein